MKAATFNRRGNTRATLAGSILRKITRPRRILALLLLAFCPVFSTFCLSAAAAPALVLQSDFGEKDGAVAAMKGVAVGVDADLKIYDLTHEIPAFNIWEGAYRLWQTAPYWPAGTVFVSVVDPGVGTNRKSVVARAKNGQYFVTPDNGTLTLVADHLGIDAVREIDETTNRRPGSEDSYTFHGRDVYAYTGARLAAGVIKFEQVGPALDAAKLVAIPWERVVVDAKRGFLEGGIPVLDPQYGNVWTNISPADLQALTSSPPKPGQMYEVGIVHLDAAYLKALAEGKAREGMTQGPTVFQADVPYANSFGDVPVGKPLLYFNSLMQLSLALNQGNFAVAKHIGSGPEWKVVIKPHHP